MVACRGQKHLLANDDVDAAIVSHIDEAAPRLPSTKITALAARPLTAMHTWGRRRRHRPDAVLAEDLSPAPIAQQLECKLHNHSRGEATAHQSDCIEIALGPPEGTPRGPRSPTLVVLSALRAWNSADPVAYCAAPARLHVNWLAFGRYGICALTTTLVLCS